MIKSAKHLSDAGAAITSVMSESDLMTWHDRWMSNDEYVAMLDTDALAIETLFQVQSQAVIAGVLE